MHNQNNKNRLEKTYIEQSTDSLPLTIFTANKFKGLLKDTVILHINHALPDVFALNEILVNILGAKLFFISTPYNKIYYQSNNYDYLYLKRDNNKFFYYLNGKRLLPNKTYDDVINNIHQSILLALSEIKDKYKDKKIIVLQDGGYSAALGEVFDNDPFINNPNFVGMVEQTQGGTRLFNEINNKKPLQYPILTISRSLIKMRVESHFIAHRILEEVNRTIYKMGYFLNFKTLIIGGYGIIGRRLAKCLEGLNAKAIILETDPYVRRLAEKDGYKTIKKIDTASIDRSFCYIGVTGVCSFGILEFICFLESKNKFYFLASGSSKRYEFDDISHFFENPAYRIKVYRLYPELNKLENIKVRKNKDGTLEYTCMFNKNKKTLFLLAEGFPVNLYESEVFGIPDRAIDPIQALLLACVVKLKSKHNILAKGINHVSDLKVKKKVDIDEENLLSEWFYLNDVHANRNKPFLFFKPHPLEKHLIKR